MLPMKSRLLRVVLALAAARAALAFAQQVPEAPGSAYGASVAPEQRRVFFGELHLHTTMSFDAWIFGTKVTPDQAYKFARGETVMVPAAQVAKEQGITTSDEVPAKRAWPLDFTAVTDHSEFLGAMHELEDPNSVFSQSAAGKKIKEAIVNRGETLQLAAGSLRKDPDVRQAVMAAAAASNAWNIEIKAANDNYTPGTFTTFIAYEWTASPGARVHMHRNVIFNSDHAPAPFTAVDSNKPEDLWKYLESARRQGIDVLAIPHNSNLSDGHDFDWNMSDGRPIDECYALERALNEPLVEIKQLKGSSETTPELSPEDEFANFEILDRVYKDETTPNQHGSYVREAYGRGLIIQGRVGTNPFKMGIVGASDIHNGLSASDEDAFASGFSGLDPKTMLPTGNAARVALGMSAATPTIADLSGRAVGRKGNARLQMSNAAITGVWAEENTRRSIFAALKRKETFATSGTRIRLRMFGGWSFDPKMLQRSNWVAAAYAGGVPMGGDLPARPSGASAPRFILQALKDPDGANLDRIQIVKVWLEGRNYQEKVFDVALSGGRADDRSGHAPAVGNTVDLTTGTYVNSIGASQLSAVWSDPQFNPATPAVYYARVLEIPTPRWPTLLAIRNHLPIPPKAPATLQQRAWTSPIWFTPAKS
jgi:uncharacterized protein DUF3604